MKEERQFRILCEKLDLLSRLLAVSMTSGKTRREQVQLLARAGLPPKQIAALIGTTRGTVSVQLTRMRKGKIPKKTAKQRREPNG